MILSNLRLVRLSFCLACSFTFLGNHNETHAQRLGSALEVLGPDSLKLYFNLAANRMVGKTCADHYRVARFSRVAMVHSGPFRDYTLDGTLLLDGYFLNNALHGTVRLYYPNGKLIESGEYRYGAKVGEWKYWYADGKPWKVLIFQPDGIYVKELYSEGGQKLVSDGNGTYVEQNPITSIKIKGSIINGRQHGKWTLSVMSSQGASERFYEGKFIKGHNYYARSEYYDESKCVLDNPLSIFDGAYYNAYDCNLSSPDYYIKEVDWFATIQYLFDYINLNIGDELPKHGYVIAGFKISKDGKIQDLQLHSTVDNDRIVQRISQILANSPRIIQANANDGPVEFNELFVFQFSNGELKLLTDPRNYYITLDPTARKPANLKPLDKGAMFSLGSSKLYPKVLEELELPPSLGSGNNDLLTCVDFYIDRTGIVRESFGYLPARRSKSQEEEALHEAVLKALRQAGEWFPGEIGERATEHFFGAVVNVKNGKVDLKIVSRNWVLSEN